MEDRRNTKKLACAVLLSSIVFLSGFAITLTQRGNAEPALAGNKSTATDPLITEMLNKVSASNLYSSIYDLQNFTGRDCETQGCTNASYYLHDKLAIYPRLQLRYEPFSYNGHQMYNVIAILPGKTSQKQYIISGHYDDVGNPGADDDASGVAVTLEAARILSQYEFDSTLVFGFWTGEEIALLGSEYYAYNASLNGWDIGADLQFDMVGHDPWGNSNITVDNYTDSGWLWPVLNGINSGYGIGLVLDETNETGRSDHESFHKRGFPGIMCIEKPLSPYYHTMQDTIDKLNMSLVAKSAKLGIATIAQLANVLSQAVTEPIAAVLPGVVLAALFFTACGNRMRSSPKH